MISILVCELSYDTGLKNNDILLRYDSQGAMPGLPAEKKSAPGEMYLWTGMEKRIFARSVAEHLIPWNVLICSSNEAASGAAAAIGFTVVVKLTKTHCHSSESIFLLHRPKKIVEWRCGGNHQACTFQVLSGGIVLYNPSRNLLLFFGLLFF